MPTVRSRRSLVSAELVPENSSWNSTRQEAVRAEVLAVFPHEPMQPTASSGGEAYSMQNRSDSDRQLKPIVLSRQTDFSPDFLECSSALRRACPWLSILQDIGRLVMCHERKPWSGMKPHHSSQSERRHRSAALSRANCSRSKEPERAESRIIRLLSPENASTVNI